MIINQANFLPLSLNNANINKTSNRKNAIIFIKKTSDK